MGSGSATEDISMTRNTKFDQGDRAEATTRVAAMELNGTTTTTTEYTAEELSSVP